MSARGTQQRQRTGIKKERSRKTSVVGSTLGDLSAKLQGRGLPRGGIREQDGLKVAEGALPDSTAIGAATQRSDIAQRFLRIAVVVLAIAIVLLVVLAIVVGILGNTAVFEVSRIETYDSEHVSADEVARLANVGDHVTLLNADADSIQNNVRRNPWVASVDVERVFPDTLRLHVNERKLGAVVAMSSGGVAWLLGDDNVWIEPIKLEVSSNESLNDAALAKANELGVTLISDAPTDVAPVAASMSTDNSIQTVMLIMSQLSAEFKQKIVCYSASTPDDISCIMQNGVEVSFGSDEDIASKEAVASRIMEEYGGQIVYINVRVPSHPTYRRVDSEYVREGTGANGTSTEEESVVPKVKALEDDVDNNSSSSSETEGEGDASEQNTNLDGQDSYTDDLNMYSDESYGMTYDSGYGYDYGYDENAY